MNLPTRPTLRPGFTLIELLAVITIIVILAGLTVGGMSYVNEKQAMEKAKVQIKLLENAIEEYKLDNGSYPGTTANTPVAGNVSNQLYKALYLDGFTNKTRIYLPQLDPNDTKQGWLGGTGVNRTIVDPWGNEYRYRKGTNPQKPDFDLWSTGKNGKPTNGNSTHTDAKDDIGNF
jgi:general secretion pathway protein G